MLFLFLSTSFYHPIRSPSLTECQSKLTWTSFELCGFSRCKKGLKSLNFTLSTIITKKNDSIFTKLVLWCRILTALSYEVYKPFLFNTMECVTLRGPMINRDYIQILRPPSSLPSGKLQKSTWCTFKKRKGVYKLTIHYLLNNCQVASQFVFFSLFLSQSLQKFIGIYIYKIKEKFR